MKNIQWFPGHMTKTRRMIASNLSLVDGVAEILDARTPLSSHNPEMDRLIKDKPHMVLLNKSDMADEPSTQKWIAYFKKNNVVAIPIDCKTGKGIKSFLPILKTRVLNETIQKRISQGAVGMPIRLMILGIPNVGKSSFINKMAKSKKTKVEDRPGVTRTKQWVKIDDGIELLDMPGVLWPKFEDQKIAVRLAFTGSINDDILDIEALSMKLLTYLSAKYPAALVSRYKIQISDDDSGLDLINKIAIKRGMLLSGGEINLERAAITIIDEFRSGKLGKITLELPEDFSNG